LRAQQFAGLRIREMGQLVLQCYHGGYILCFIGMVSDCTSSVSSRILSPVEEPFYLSLRLFSVNLET
jgi:hypothetical protein